MIYLDNNATTRIHPGVVDAMRDCYAQQFVNPASQHAGGRRARRVLEEARSRIGELLGARFDGRTPDQVVFTSGGTEANNLVLLGVPARHRRVVISALEHPSVTAAADELERRGWDVVRLPAHADGQVDLGPLRAAIEQGVDLVSVMLANNETGVLQPLDEVVAACPPTVLVHSDAVQVIGKIPFDFQALGVTAVSVAAHKFHGPPGIGALVLRHGAPLTPLLHGGFQQGGLRPGTETVALAVGMCRALELWHHEQQERAARMKQLRDRFESGVLRADPAAVVIGRSAPRLPHTSCIAFPGLDRQALLMALDLEHIACSTGSACASGSSEPSPVLRAMQLDDALVSSALRFSLGADTTDVEIDRAIAVLAKVLHAMRSRAGGAPTARPPAAGSRPL